MQDRKVGDALDVLLVILQHHRIRPTALDAFDELTLVLILSLTHDTSQN
jgi:hypothetical protein